MRAEQVHEIDRFKLDFKKEVEQNQILEEIQLAEFEEQAKLVSFTHKKSSLGSKIV